MEIGRRKGWNKEEMREKRLDAIEQYIFEKKNASLDLLCQEFQVSKNTIRRDLEELSRRGNIRKVYGGVKLAGDAAGRVELSAFDERTISHREEKDLICKKAAALVKEGDTIFIDTGTSCTNLVKYIGKIPCSIVSNSLRVACNAQPYEKLQLIMLPGTLRRETMSFVGIETVERLRIYNIDKAFMAATGLSLDRGLTNASVYEYNIKKEVISRSRKRFLMADHSKFGKTALYTFCDFESLDAVITDMPPAAEYRDYFRSQNIELLS